MDKPPYVVPSMAEVARLKGSNGYRAVSTFSGCGGSCLGLEMAGFEILMASEFVEAARDTYRLNHPGVFVDDRDVRTVTADDILEQVGVAVGEIDLLEGSPPCASFSTAGKRDKAWGEVKRYSETKQRVDDLFFEYARLIAGLQPKVFIAENVSGLVKGVAKGYFKMILRKLKDCGYRVEAKLLDARWLGVPQSRQRLIFMGVRNDLGVGPEWPEPLPYWYSIRDACPWITNGGVMKDGYGAVETRPVDTERPAGTVTTKGVAHVDGHQILVNPPDGEGQPGPDWEAYLLANGHPAAPPEEFQLVDIRQYAIGREWLRLHPGQGSDKYLNLIRTNADKPVNTVTQMAGESAGVAGVTHPSEPRKFTILELRRLCSFPDDFALTGSFAQRWERLGRAVPPLMMRAVGESVRSVLDQA